VHMNKIIRRTVSVFLMIAYLASSLAFTALASGYDGVLAKLSSQSVISKTGLPASSVYTRSGDFTMKLSDGDIYKDITIPAGKSDISGYEALTFWVYSANSLKSNITLALVSDNSQTACLDSYTTTFSVRKQGWNQVILPFSQDSTFFAENHSPVGFDSIDSLRLWPYYDGNEPTPGAELYFDDITLIETLNTDVESDNESTTGGNSGISYGYGNEDRIIYDFSTEANVREIGHTFSTKHAYTGEGTSYWPHTQNFILYPRGSVNLDISGYEYFQILAYNEAPASGKSTVLFVSENSLTTDGVDGYSWTMTPSWTGWKILTFPFFGEGLGLYRQPIGLDHIDGFEIWRSGDETAEMYIDRMWLTNQPYEDIYTLQVDDTTDYHIAANTSEVVHDVASLIKQNNPNGQHPRLMLTQADFDNLKTYVKTVPFLKRAYENVLSEADRILGAPVQGYSKSDGKRIDRVACSFLVPLALAYKISGEEKYKDRLWLELEDISHYPDWNPGHSIDVSDYARPVALAYDWLYNDWTEEERRVIRNGMVRCGLQTLMGPIRLKNGYYNINSNHNIVTFAGIGMIALAIGDVPGYEDICNEVINASLTGMPYYMKYYAPDGVSVEGPHYWAYGLNAYFEYEASLFSAVGTDFGIKDYEGMNKTGYYLISNGSASDLEFNYGDASDDSDAVSSPSLLWLARLYNQPELAGYRMEKEHIEPGSWHDLVYYRADLATDDYRNVMKKDNVFGGMTSVGTLRSTYDNTNGMSVQFKGGMGKENHSDLDAGTFVLDAGGERWIKDLGSESYDKPYLFSGFKDISMRWMYYRKRAEGHNTLVVNPRFDGIRYSDQNIGVGADITDFESEDSGAYAIIDLSKKYDDVLSARRGYALIEDRSTIIVQDEVKSDEPIELYTFYHTKAEIELSNDKKTAILSQNGKKLKVTLASPSNAEFKIMAPESVIPELKNDGGSDRSAYKKLGVHVMDSTDTTISVVFRSVYDGVAEPELPELKALDMWYAYLQQKTAQLDLMSVDGVPVDNFSSDNRTYTIEMNGIAEVSAEASDDSKVTVVQATEENKTAVVCVENDSGVSNYTVTFTEPNRIYKPVDSDYESYEIKDCYTEFIPQPENPPEGSIDGDTSTRWSGEGDAWIWYDLGEIKQVDSIYIYFHKGNERYTIFDIQISNDARNWKTVFEGQSSGKTAGLEAFSFPLSDARYIRYFGHGNSSSAWNSLLEVNIPVPSLVNFYDIAGHWAEDSIFYMANEGFVSGVGGDYFAPDENVTLAEASALILRILGIEPEAAAEGEMWYAPYISAMQDCGIIANGWADAQLLTPDTALTREQMCTLMANAYTYQTKKTVKTYDAVSKFEDVSQMSAEGRESIDKCISLHIVNGKTETKFEPLSNLTRAEATVLLERLYLKIFG